MPRKKKSEDAEPTPLAEASLADAAVAADWDHDQQIVLLCRFIDEKGLGSEFKEFIVEQAESDREEDDDFDEDDEDEDADEDDDEDDADDDL